MFNGEKNADRAENYRHMVAAVSSLIAEELYGSQKTTHMREGSFLHHSAAAKPQQEGKKRSDRRADGIVFGKHMDVIACLSNTSAIINFYMDTINWAGFYIAQDDVLVLGPFQGLPACIRIKFGKGVCGTAAASGEVQVVPDVEAFPGHIACDSNSRSEIVLPIFNPDGTVYGVLDIDSPTLNRFSEMERSSLEQIVKNIEAFLRKDDQCSN